MDGSKSKRHAKFSGFSGVVLPSRLAGPFEPISRAEATRVPGPNPVPPHGGPISGEEE